MTLSMIRLTLVGCVGRYQ